METNKTGSCYWMPAAVGLTGVNGETKIATIKDPAKNVEVIGGMTDLVTSQALLTNKGGGSLYSDDLIPLLALFGKRDSSDPLRRWTRSQQLRSGDRFRTRVVNVGVENGGTVIFIGYPDEEAQPSLTDPNIGEPFFLPINSKFTGSVNDRTTNETTQQDDAVVIYGAMSDLISARLRLRGANDAIWMNDSTPIWAIAGRASGNKPVLEWPRPYVLPPNSTIKAEFENPGGEAGGSIFFVCRKLKG